jgi:hypothetical protein
VNIRTVIMVAYYHMKLKDSHEQKAESPLAKFWNSAENCLKFSDRIQRVRLPRLVNKHRLLTKRNHVCPFRRLRQLMLECADK